MELIHDDCGLVFTKYDINITRKQLIIIKNEKQSAARVGSIAPTDLQPMAVETRITKSIIRRRTKPKNIPQLHACCQVNQCIALHF